MEKVNDNNLSREIRKEFFAFRNGIVADKLRKAGDSHTMIMGCLLSDVVQITNRMRDAVADDESLAALAQQLWDDTASRECRLAAPMLYPASMMTRDMAMQWCRSVENVEIADNLCHKLLRHIADADDIFLWLTEQDTPLAKYTGYRLLLNLLLLGKVKPSQSIKSIVEAEAAPAGALYTPLLRDIMEELNNPEA